MRMREHTGSQADMNKAGQNTLSRFLSAEGFTLVEMIVVIVITAIIGGIAAMIISQGVAGYSAEEQRSNVHYQAKLAAERIAREVRVMRSATAADIFAWTATDLQFCDITGKAVEFQFTGTSLNRRESASCTPLSWGSWNTLSPLIDTANSSFAYYQQNGTSAPATVTSLWYVQVTVKSTQGAESLQVRTRVHPMNF